MRQQILVLQNNSQLPQLLKQMFEQLGFDVVVCQDAATALRAIAAAPPRLVLIDAVSPRRSTLDFCREIRRSTSDIPILVLSEEVDVVDKVLLLELGADDCIVKPFNPRELLARIHVALRRTGPTKESHSAYRFDEIEVNFDTMELFRSGKPVPLTKQEFKVLRFFLSNKQRVLSRHELLNAVWGYQSCPTTRTVDTHILRLRQKLEKDPVAPTYFRTVHGAGYKFVG